jgi:hypothetical protein
MKTFSERNKFISSNLLQNLTFSVSVLQSVLSGAVDRGFEHRSDQKLAGYFKMFKKGLLGILVIEVSMTG